MEIKGERPIRAKRAVVWDALGNVDILSAAIPGCEFIEQEAENRFKAAIRASIGPVSARFLGTVTRKEVEAVRQYMIAGEGAGGVAGFARGSATITLEDQADGTLLQYVVTAEIGGKLAQIGARLVHGTAVRLASEFFERLSKAISAAEASRQGARHEVSRA